MIGTGTDVSVIIEEEVILFGTSLPHSAESLAILEAMHSIDAQHGGSKVSMELGESRFAKSNGTALNDTRDDATNRVTLCLYIKNQLLHLLGHLSVWTTHRILLYLREIIFSIVTLNGDISYL